MNIESIKAMLGSADRIKELLARREEVEEERSKLAEELGTIDADLAELTGQSPDPVRARAVQKCSLCQKEGHTKRTCPTKGAS